MTGTTLAIRDEAHYLATVAEVRALCERIDTVQDAKALADKAAAAKVWAERAKLGQEQVNLAAIARVWAERRAGELLAVIPNHGGDRRSESRSPLPTLNEIGITRDQSSEWQRMASIPADEFQSAVDEAASEGSVSRGRVMAVHYSSATDLWATPQDLFDELNGEFPFTLDVCATPENAKCEQFFTREDDGLAQRWSGVCWMNPPYGDEIARWVEKAHNSATTGDATVVCLVPARVDTGWWWEHARFGAVRFLRGRLKFGGGTNSAPFPSAVVVFNRDTPANTVYWERR